MGAYGMIHALVLYKICGLVLNIYMYQPAAIAVESRNDVFEASGYIEVSRWLYNKHRMNGPL